ncbi:MAG: peptide MFS transporter, partial [Luteibaculum sp.]
GGIMADKLLGYRKAVMLGALLMTLGHGSMALETEFFFYLGLGLLILGNGFFKPNISSIVGQIYKNESEKKDAAYTIFYMGINAGAFLGILLCGYIGEKVGWSFGFGLAGIFMFLGMLMFHFGQGIFGKIGLRPNSKAALEAAANDDEEDEVEEEQNPKVIRDRLFAIVIFSFFTIFFWMAFEQAGGSMTIFAKDYTQRILTGGNATLFFWLNTILTIAPLAIVTYVLFLLFKVTFKKYFLSNLWLGLSFVIIWGAAIWMLNKEFNMRGYEIEIAEGNSVTVRFDEELAPGTAVNLLDLDGKGTYKLISEEEVAEYSSITEGTILKKKENETEVPASWFGILNSFFIISFAPVFSKIWASKFNPTGPQKFALGLILLGLGFAALAFGGMSIAKGADSAAVSMGWLIVAYLLHTLGELCVSPVGLSYVSKLAPVKLVGLMFGIWFGCTAIANYFAGLSGSLIDTITEKYSISAFFMIYTILPVAAGLVLFAINKWMLRKMHGIR